MIGMGAGAAESLTGVPLTWAKNSLQRAGKLPGETPLSRAGRLIKQMGLEVHQDPRAPWRGFGVNLLAIGPTTGVQIAVNALLCGDRTDLTVTEKMRNAAIAGVAGAVFAAPTESAIRHQQRTREQFWKTMRGAPLTKALMLVSLRDAMFAPAYLVSVPELSRGMRQYTDSAALSKGSAVVMTSVLTTLLTQPLDTAAAVIRDAHIDKYVGKVPHVGTSYGVLRAMIAKEGVGFAYKGALPRGIRIALATYVMGSVNMYGTEWMTSRR